jgi:hypothetical protein
LFDWRTINDKRIRIKVLISSDVNSQIGKFSSTVFLVLLSLLLLFNTIPHSSEAITAAFAQDSEMQEGEGTEEMSSENSLIASSTEWIGIFAIGITAGIGASLRNIQSTSANTNRIRIVLGRTCTSTAHHTPACCTTTL